MHKRMSTRKGRLENLDEFLHEHLTRISYAEMLAHTYHAMAYEWYTSRIEKNINRRVKHGRALNDFQRVVKFRRDLEEI